MDAYTHDYDTAMAAITARLVDFLRSFEQLQQSLDFRQPASAQAQLRAVGENLFASLPATLARLVPPAQRQAAHAQLQLAVARWARALTQFLDETPGGFATAFIASRRLLCEGLRLAYGVGEHFPLLQAYWLTATATLDTAPVSAVDVPVGVMHHPATSAHAEYALYVPETYTPARVWPLLVCLHGAYGHGHEYLWTWMRVARSHGCLILAPKSIGPTWSLVNPPLDIASIQAMLVALAARYRLDQGRLYLSGLSDGGSFAYVLGLTCASLFAGVAPIAAVVHPVLDPLLRQQQGQALPLFVVHGAQDFIFDVRSVRSQCALLDKLGYRITYHELPQWGHAYTDAINEQWVWPWCAGLTSP